MRCHPWLVSLAALAAVAALLAGPAATSTASVPGGPNAHVVATFPTGVFPESLAVDPGGDLYLSLGFAGEVVRIHPDGTLVRSWSLSPGAGLLTGLAFDQQGMLYVAAATFDDAAGVYRIDPGSAGAPVQVLSLPAESFPNGLAVHGGYLYVADSFGPIWRGLPGGAASVWLSSDLLVPAKGLGSNGIAFRAGSLYVAVSEWGRIVRVPLVGRSDSAGTPEVATEQQELRTADGIAFDAGGSLWVAVNAGNKLVRLSPSWTLERVANRSDGLSYPTMPAFAPGRPTLYVASGALFMRLPAVEPNVVALDAGVAGVPLPQ